MHCIVYTDEFGNKNVDFARDFNHAQEGTKLLKRENYIHFIAKIETTPIDIHGQKIKEEDIIYNF